MVVCGCIEIVPVSDAGAECYRVTRRVAVLQTGSSRGCGREGERQDAQQLARLISRQVAGRGWRSHVRGARPQCSEALDDVLSSRKRSSVLQDAESAYSQLLARLGRDVRPSCHRMRYRPSCGHCSVLTTMRLPYDTRAMKARDKGDKRTKRGRGGGSEHQRWSAGEDEGTYTRIPLIGIWICRRIRSAAVATEQQLRSESSPASRSSR